MLVPTKGSAEISDGYSSQSIADRHDLCPGTAHSAVTHQVTPHLLSGSNRASRSTRTGTAIMILRVACGWPVVSTTKGVSDRSGAAASKTPHSAVADAFEEPLEFVSVGNSGRHASALCCVRPGPGGNPITDVWAALEENGGALADSAPARAGIHADKVTARQLHRSVRPLGTSVARVTKACAHRLRPCGRREFVTDEPRQPTHPELRPNQRLN